MNAFSAAGGCQGIVAVAPDVRLTYDAGGYDLTVRTSANTDTILLINGPDGRWYCDDDSGGGADAAFAFFNRNRASTPSGWGSIRAETPGRSC